ncbi:MAG: hypothetical protein PHV17_06905 [Candidatus Omnitrophica bacterium]|nr:hypothetical protein [Candidatus Omnitrophota bacterium]
MVYFEKKDKWRWLPNTPIAKFRGEEVITDDSVYWKVANKYGVDDYIQKPVYVDDLIKIIDLNIEKRSKKGQIDDDLYFLGPSSGS